MAVRKLKPTTRVKDTRLLVLLKRLLHRYQKNLLYAENSQPAVATETAG